MSDVRDPNTDSQDAPIRNSNPFVQDLLIEDIEERKQFGIRKYGTALQAGNGRDMLQDAYEEILDLAVYLRGAIEEAKSAPKHTKMTEKSSGNSYCQECSVSVSEYVNWPCSPDAVVRQAAINIKVDEEWKNRGV